MSAIAPLRRSSNVFERWLISMTDMPTPGSETSSRCACSSTGSGMMAGPAEKLNSRDDMWLAYTGRSDRTGPTNCHPDTSGTFGVSSFSRTSNHMRQQAVAKLRLKPRRLRRHDAAGVGNRHEIVHAHRVH